MHTSMQKKINVSYCDEERQDTWVELTNECQLVLSQKPLHQSSPVFMTWASKHPAQVRRPRRGAETTGGSGWAEVWAQLGCLHKPPPAGGRETQGSRAIEERTQGRTGLARPLGAFVSSGPGNQPLILALSTFMGIRDGGEGLGRARRKSGNIPWLRWAGYLEGKWMLGPAC